MICANKWLTDNPSFKLLVMAGTITRATSQRITQELMDDVECCLVFTNQPKCNGPPCKESYSGREIMISNTGAYQPLKESSKCGPS